MVFLKDLDMFILPVFIKRANNKKKGRQKNIPYQEGFKNINILLPKQHETFNKPKFNSKVIFSHPNKKISFKKINRQKKNCKRCINKHLNKRFNI